MEKLWQHICIPCWNLIPEERISAQSAIEILSNVSAMEGIPVENVVRSRPFTVYLFGFVVVYILFVMYH